MTNHEPHYEPGTPPPSYVSPNFEKLVRRSQRQIWLFGAAAIIATLAISAGVIGGLIYIFRLAVGM